MGRRFVMALCLSFGLLCSLEALTRATAGAEATSFQIVAHPANPTRSMSLTFARDAFLKRIARWPDGETIMPVDLSATSPVRAVFVQTVLARPLTAVRMYWQQIVFSGRGVPPPELESDEAVLRYVLSHRGALGYVSATTACGEARVVALK